MIEQPKKQMRTLCARDEGVQASDNDALKMLAGRCPFCQLTELNHKILGDTEHFYIIENRFPYSVWDSHRVQEHLLLLPKQHVVLLADLPAEALDEYTKLVTEYGSDNYSTYARSADNPARSQPHHHTHLIKIETSEPVEAAAD